MPHLKDNHIRYAGAAALFLALLGLCWLFPLTGDDWFREELGLGLHSLPDLAREVARRWQTVNGRILGNVLAYSAGGRKVLRELLRSSILLGTVCLTARHAGFRSLRGMLLTAAALLALPRDMFRQIYPWAAGFFNYVPPVLLLLAALWLMRDVFDEQPVKGGPARAAAVFLLGFCGQLFIESDTLYAVCAGAVLLAWHGWSQRRLSAVAAAFLTGTVLGAALLFASPSYGLIGESGGAYETSLFQGLSGLAAMAEENRDEVLRWLISGCPVLFVGLTALGLVWFARSERRRADWAAALALAGGCVYFAANFAADLLPRGNLPAVLLWGLALGYGCWRWLPKGGGRNRALFFWGSAAAAAAPLLFVSPVGARCLYLSYVFLLLTAGNLLTALPLERLPVRASGAVAVLLAAAVLGFYVWLFRPIHLLELERTALVERAMAEGRAEVVLPAYPHEDCLWEGNTDKLQYRYYYEEPGDLAVRYVPVDQWDGVTG